MISHSYFRNYLQSIPLMNNFNKTEAAVFTCRLCFLRAFPFISLLSQPLNIKHVISFHLYEHKLVSFLTINKIHVKSIINMYLIDCSVPRSWAASELWPLVARRVSSQTDCSLPRSWAALTASVGGGDAVGCCLDSELWPLVARWVSSQTDCSLPRSWAALTASVR